MGVLFNQVDRTDLKVGDHVYSWRTGYTYAHHGIYVGDNDVIHFTRGPNQEAEARLIDSFVSSSIPKQHLTCPRYPDSCDSQNENSGVIRSCLDCFLEGGAVYRFEYGVSIPVFFAQARGGTCTLAQSDPPDTVVHRARYLHQNGFAKYDLFSKNCEDFALYCRTGFIVKTNASGSGQVAAMQGVWSTCYVVACTFSNIMVPKSLRLALLVGTYPVKRYIADIGVRVDKSKVKVEELAVSLDSSTGIRVDKTKAPVEDKTKGTVEDVAVYLWLYILIFQLVRNLQWLKAPHLRQSADIEAPRGRKRSSVNSRKEPVN